MAKNAPWTTGPIDPRSIWRLRAAHLLDARQIPRYATVHRGPALTTNLPHTPPSPVAPACRVCNAQERV